VRSMGICMVPVRRSCRGSAQQEEYQ